MEIVVNGEKRSVPNGITLSALINELGVLDRVMAAAVNMDIVKKENWESFVLSEGDRVELLHFVGGG
jgi:sulfur carrier protein